MKRAQRRMHVSDYYETCSTRDRGKEFFPSLIERLEAAPTWGEVVLSFEGVEFVSPSFLDETLVCLAEKRPDLAKRLLIVGLPSFTAKRLKSILHHRGLSWTLQQRARDGEYSLMA